MDQEKPVPSLNDSNDQPVTEQSGTDQSVSEHFTVRRQTPQALFGLSLLEYMFAVSDETDFMADSFLTDPSITMLYATDGIGKSLIGIQAGLELASGLPVFKALSTTRKYKVIYVQAERSIKEPIKRLKRMIADKDFHDKLDLGNFAITTEFQGRDLSDHRNADALMDILRQRAIEIGGCDIIFFDPLYALVHGDLKSDEAINSVFNFFRRAGTELQTNIFFMHHENRGQRLEGDSQRSGQDFYGNKFISGLCTAVWHMKKVAGDQFKTIIHNEKDTESALLSSFKLDYDPVHGTVRAQVKACPKVKDIAIREYLAAKRRAKTNFTSDELFDALGLEVHEASRRRLIASLLHEGKIRNTMPNGFKGVYEAL